MSLVALLEEMMMRALCRRGGMSLPAFSRSVVTKTSTGIVGLEVDHNGRENFIKQCEAILEALKPIPEWSAYRIDLERIINFRLKTARENEDVRASMNNNSLVL